MANTLFLRLEGPLQSWGERARWDVRDTAPEPTKSGVVGLLACALGWNSDQALRSLSRQIRIGVRCDRPGQMLVDYHTITGGVMGGEGKVRRGTVQSWRSYLCDASFLVAIGAAPDVVERLAEAVQAPCWPYYLGRKCCPPSRPPFDGVGDFASLEEALTEWPWRREGAQPGTVECRAVLECAPAQGVRRRDEIESRQRRTFGPRYTRDVLLTVPVTPLWPVAAGAQEGPCTSRA